MENPKKERRGLDERFKAYPKLGERLQEIADELDLSLAQGGSLDEAGERVAPLLRQLGVEVMEARAQRIAAEAPGPSGVRAHRHSKKKSAGWRASGWIEVLEQVWQVDGVRHRPFCRQAGVRCGGSSRRVQRSLSDFGADGAFAAAAKKFWNITGWR